MENKTRNNYWDIIKGLAIILVVIGHCIQYGSGQSYIDNRLFFDNPVFKIIYSFHMPLFIFVSGYFYESSLQKYSIKELIFKKLQAIAIPLISWGGVDFVIFLLKNKDSLLLNPVWLLKKLVWSMLNAPWFLWVLLMCMVLAVILHVLNNKWFAFAFLFFVSFWLPNSFNISKVCYLFPFFAIGQLANRKEIIQKLKDNTKGILTIFSISSVAYIILMLFFNRNSYIYTSGFSAIESGFSIRQVAIDIYRWAVGLAGITSVLTLVAIVYHRWRCKTLSFVGKQSLGIYITNIYVNLYLLPVIVRKEGPIVWITLLETICVVLMCLLATMLLSCIKPTAFLFLGKKK